MNSEFVKEIRSNGEIHSVNGPDGSINVFAPNGQFVREIKPVNHALHDHVVQSVELHKVSSFCDYVNGFDDGRSVIFADAKESSILAVIDYHVAAAKAKNTEPENPNVKISAIPAVEQYCQHRAKLLVPFSEQWKRWTAIDGKEMTQGNFAEFLEENYLDVSTPDHADLLEIVTNLQAKNDVVFGSKINLANGQTQFTYEEKIDGKGKGTIDVPREIFLSIPIHFGGPLYKVRVFFRYRVNNGSLHFIMKINRRELMVQEAFETIVEGVSTDTGCNTVYGKLMN